MGAWGAGIFEDDLALDVRASFEDALEAGRSVGEATEQVLESFRESLQDPDEGPVIYLALAASQLEQGELEPAVRDRAVEIIERGEGLERWEEAGQEALSERRRELQRLRARLLEGSGSNPKKPARGRGKVSARVGDCYLIHLPSGRKAYAQYVHRHPEYGPMVRVFDIVTDREVGLEELASAGELFPPVFVALERALRDGAWERIGSLPVTDFVFPKFRRALVNGPGVYHNWRIWDGEKDTYVGDLPPEYRGLEMLSIWGYEILAKRIDTGENIDHQLR